MASGQRLVKTPRSRMEFSKESRPALTVPKTTWFFRTRLRIMRSVSTSIGPLRPGTPVKTNAVGAEIFHHFKRQARGPGGFVHEINVADLLGKHFGSDCFRGNIMCADRFQ